MGSAAWRTSAVAVADASAQALGLQEPPVTHEPYLGPTGGFGDSDFGSPVGVPGTVSRQHGRRVTESGQEVEFKATVAFQREIAIDTRDRITLWDGLTGPIVDIARGTVNPATGRPCAVTVFLG